MIPSTNIGDFAPLANGLKMMNNLVKLLVLVPALLSSCGGDGGGCNPIEYVVDDYTLASVHYVQDYAIGQYPRIEPVAIVKDDVVAWDKFSVKLEAQYRKFKTASLNPSSLKPELRFSFFQQAYACSPGFISRQRIAKISITSNNSFNDFYPAGSELSALFISPITQDVTSIAELSVSKAQAPMEIKMKLRQSPQYSPQAFRVEIILSDGGFYTMESGAIHFELAQQSISQ